MLDIDIDSFERVQKMTALVLNPRILAIGAALAAFAIPANAAPQNLTIRLTDGAGYITVADNSVAPPAGDTDAATNTLDYDATNGPALPGGSHASVQATATNTPDLATLAASIEWDISGGLPGDTLTFEVSATD
jgi:hypothetical protein